MTTAELLGLITGGIASALLAVIAYLLSSRFAEQQKCLDDLVTKVGAQEVSIARLTEAQKAVTTNQATLSRIQEKMVEESNDLEDIIQQLQDATSSLRRRWEEHVSIHTTMFPEKTVPA